MVEAAKQGEQQRAQEELDALSAASRKPEPPPYLSGMEELVVDGLLRKKSALGEPVSTKSGIGVIAGPYGLAYGAALTRAKGADGNPIPVVMIVENQRQKELAEKVATSAHVILLSEHGGDVRRAVQAAKKHLADIAGVSQPLEVGTDGEVKISVARALDRFGIVPESVQLWTDFIRDAALAFQA